MKDMYLHSAELKNAVTVTQNGSTFLLVWTHVSRYGVNWLYCCYVCKVLTVVMQSSQFSNFQLFTLFYFILLYLFTDCFLPLTPSGCATASVGGYVPVFFFPLGFWVFVSGSAHDQLSLSDFILDYLYIFLLNLTLNFLWYLNSSKHLGSRFELHTHSHLLVMNINRNTWNFQFPLLECHVPLVCFNASIIGALFFTGVGTGGKLGCGGRASPNSNFKASHFMR